MGIRGQLALLHAAAGARTRRRPIRLGIVASRKLGDAVRRNRAKRLIREIFRRHQPLPGGLGVDLVVIPRRELFDAPFSDLERDFRAALATRRCPTASGRCRLTPPRGTALGRGAARRARPDPRYQLLFSPDVCRILPVRAVVLATTPREAIEQFRRRCAASWLAVRRLTRCHPFGGHGLDPVPRPDPRAARSTVNSWKNAFSSRSSCRSSCCTATRRCSRRRSRRSRRRRRPAAPAAPARPRPAGGPAAASAAAEAPRRAAAAARAARRRHGRARDRRRERLGARGLHDPRRRAQELAAEEVSGRRDGSRSSSCRRTRPPGCRGRSRWRSTTPRVSKTLAQALFGRARQSLDATQRPGHARRSSTRTPSGLTRAQGVLVRSRSRRTWCTVTRERRRRAATPLVPTIQWGPALGTALDVEHAAATTSPPQPIFYTRRRRRAHRRRPTSPRSRTQQGTFGFAGVDDHYFLSAAVEPERAGCGSQYRAGADAGCATDRRGSAAAVRRLVGRRSPAPPSGAAFFFGPEGLRRARARSTATWCAPSTSACSRGSSCRCCAR